MKRIYVAGPYRAPTPWEVERNIRRAEELAFQVCEAGSTYPETPYMAVCPHTMYRYFDGTANDIYWLRATLSLLETCDGIIMVPGYDQSAGATAELKCARNDLKIPIFFSIDELIYHATQFWRSKTTE